MSRSRNFTILAAWLAYLGVIVYLANSVGVFAIPLAAIMMVPLLVLMNVTPKDEKGRNASKAKVTEKRKRERIDNMIRDMSDDDLFELRQRLQDGSYDEEMLYDHVVGDDGELVSR